MLWDRLRALFKETPVTNEIRSVVPEVAVNHVPDKVMKHEGPSTHIGYNYLKGMDGDYEDSSKHLRRFINLNKLLRGNYHAGKIEARNEGPESDLRGEDTK